MSDDEDDLSRPGRWFKLRKPLVSDMTIKLTPDQAMFSIIPDDFGNPDTAHLSTYEITLKLKVKPETDTERKALKDKLLSVFDSAECHEPFRMHNAGHMMRDHYVEVDWSKDSPEVKVNGVFTLDMLNGLYETGLLESTSRIAHQYKDAAQVEVRGPLMSPFADPYDDSDYTIFKSSSDYSRENIRRKSGLGVGDVCSLEPNERYDGIISDLKEAVGLGALSMEDAMGHLPKIAALTLDGALPSPYPSGPLALAQAYAAETGNDSTELAVPDQHQTAALTQRVLRERTLQVEQDFVGSGQHLVMPKPNSKIVEAAFPGKSQPVTPNKLLEQFEAEWDERSKQRYAENLKADLAYLHGLEPTSHTPVTADELSKLIDGTKEQKVKEQEASGVTALVPYSQIMPLSKGDDPTFFGVTHKGIFENAWGDQVDYQSRNPLFDKPRPIPAGLQFILDEEEKTKNKPRDRLKLGDGMVRV